MNLQKCGTRDTCRPFRLQHSIECWEVKGYRCCSFVPHPFLFLRVDSGVYCPCFVFTLERTIYLGREVCGELILGRENCRRRMQEIWIFNFLERLKKFYESLMIVKYSIFLVMRIMILMILIKMIGKWISVQGQCIFSFMQLRSKYQCYLVLPPSILLVQFSCKNYHVDQMVDNANSGI